MIGVKYMIDEKKLIEDLEQYAHLSAGDSVDTIKVIIKIVGDQTKIGEWIPCSERLPDDRDNRFYMCAVENHEEDPPMFCQYEEEYGFGFWNDIYDEHTLGFVDSEFKTNEELGYEKVIAWQPLPEPYREGQKTKKRTNADRIRNMTDEELAKEIAEGIECMQCPYNDDYETCGAIECEKLFLDWLQSEADQKGQEL